MSDSIENVSFDSAPPNKFPRCPHCREALKTIWVKADSIGVNEQREIWMCPHCEAFLSYGWNRLF